MSILPTFYPSPDPWHRTLCTRCLFSENILSSTPKKVKIFFPWQLILNTTRDMLLLSSLPSSQDIKQISFT
uniref:Uncharacterized protein n=1 Tax=Rhizophora mucronata TaxID=61149 RepID=A0A2P2NGK4_RHIMU